MFSEKGIRTQWQIEADSNVIDEAAEVCAMYQLTGIDGNDEFVEICSGFYLDEKTISEALFEEIARYREKLVNFEASIFYYSVSDSFKTTHSKDGLLAESSYRDARQFFVSPMQPLRSMVVPELAYDKRYLLDMTICNSI